MRQFVSKNINILIGLTIAVICTWLIIDMFNYVNGIRDYDQRYTAACLSNNGNVISVMNAGNQCFIGKRILVATKHGEVPR